MGHWPENVGILAIESYFPAQYVDQSELEEFDSVSAGKYTVGLGQQKMGFCTDREDINSLCMTAFQRLLERHQVSLTRIGHLEVGTETIIDKSKSTKTVLMQLLDVEDGTTDVEGIDTTNACYGGTAAIFNALNWVESSAWDGRLACVVAADIAVYAKGSARPTGGAGAVALLIGPDAPLVFDRGVRSTHMRNVYDFYKPDLTSQYPVVDGKLSIECYLSALDACYALYKEKTVKTLQLSRAPTLASFDAFVCHTPYGKLVQKSVARLALNDFLGNPENCTRNELKDVTLANSYFNRTVEKLFLERSRDDFLAKTKPSLLLSNQLGNMYTASLWSGLVSYLLSKPVAELCANKVGLFSYGSGMAATLFSITVTEEASKLQKLVDGIKHVVVDLKTRIKVAPKQFECTLEKCQQNAHSAPFHPTASVDNLMPGTYYLKEIDAAHRRIYERIPFSVNGHLEH